MNTDTAAIARRNRFGMHLNIRLRRIGEDQFASRFVCALAFYNKAVEQEEMGDLQYAVMSLHGFYAIAREAFAETRANLAAHRAHTRAHTTTLTL